MEKYLKPIETSAFKKDIKRIKKRGKDLKKLERIILMLVREQTLPTKNKDHALTGNWANYRDCHIEPDWLLIYQIDAKNNILKLARTGSHSDLF